MTIEKSCPGSSGQDRFMLFRFSFSVMLPLTEKPPIIYPTSQLRGSTQGSLFSNWDEREVSMFREIAVGLRCAAGYADHVDMPAIRESIWCNVIDVHHA